MSMTQTELAWKTYLQHRAALFGYARKLAHDATLAEDAVHDAVLEVAQSMTPKRDMKAYLFRSVRNRAFRLISRNGREVSASNGQLTDLLEPKRADAEVVA